jgi:hypothetical protein
MPGQIPKALVLQPADINNPPAPLELTQQLFVGNVSSTDAPLPYHNKGFLGVQAARVYDHGQCSGLQKFDDLFATINTQLWSFIAQFIVTADGTCPDDESTATLGFSTIASYLTHTPGDPLSAGGGFLLNTQFLNTINAPASLVGQDNHVTFTYRYDYVLTDGILSLTPTQVLVPTLIDGYNADGLRTTIDQVLTTGILGKPCSNGPGMSPGTPGLPEIFQNLARRKQAVPFPSSCTLEETQPCAAAQVQLAALIGTTGLALTSTEKAALEATAAAMDSNGVYTNWSCVLDSNVPPFCPPDGACPPPPDPGSRHCEYAVRAKRLNVFPDEVELVWFDGKELDNPTYALYAALHSPMAPAGSLDQLCPARTPVTTRAFVKHDMPRVTLTSDGTPCPPCSKPETGCAQSAGRTTRGGSALLLLLLAAAAGRARQSGGRAKRPAATPLSNRG